mgnify:CR=1 FL=1
MNEIIVLILGTLYGLIIGIIPAAGATTGLVALFGFMSYFTDPYLGVIFCMAVVFVAIHLVHPLYENLLW